MVKELTNWFWDHRRALLAGPARSKRCQAGQQCSSNEIQQFANGSSLFLSDVTPNGTRVLHGLWPRKVSQLLHNFRGSLSRFAFLNSVLIFLCVPAAIWNVSAFHSGRMAHEQLVWLWNCGNCFACNIFSSSRFPSLCFGLGLHREVAQIGPAEGPPKKWVIKYARQSITIFPNL